MSGILARKIKELEKKNEGYLSFIIGQPVQEVPVDTSVTPTQPQVNPVQPEVSEYVKFIYRRLYQIYTDFFNKVSGIKNEIYELSKPYVSQFDFSRIYDEVDNIVNDYSELEKVYEEGEQGNINTKIAIIYSQVSVPIPINNIRRKIAEIFSLLEQLKDEAQRLFSPEFENKDTSGEDKRVVRWEAAYLSNLSIHYTKVMADIYNDKAYWSAFASKGTEIPVAEEVKQPPIQTVQPKEMPVNEIGQPFTNYPDVAPNEGIKSVKDIGSWRINDRVRLGYGVDYKVINIFEKGKFSVRRTYLLESKGGKRVLFDPYNGLSKWDDIINQPQPRVKRYK